MSSLRATLKGILWFPLMLISVFHLLAFIGSYHVPLNSSGSKAFLAMYAMTGLGVTVGYHRQWSHVAYQSHRIWRAWWAFWGAGSLQGSILWWSRLHRLHHKYTDTSWDPYSGLKGFWHSHVLWMFQKVDRTNALKTLDMTDLTEDVIVAFQHRHYPSIGLFCAFVMPLLLFPNEPWQAIVYGIFWARLFTWHSTWCVNSVAHWLGANEFSDVISAKDHFATSLLTFGEGNHGFHHAFPDSYRNGINWYDYDPTGWLIALFSKMGVTFDLTHPAQNFITLTKYLTLQNRNNRILAKMQKEMKCFPDMDRLRQNILSQAQIEDTKAEGKYYLIIDNWVHDVTNFREEHPGGQTLMEKNCFKYANEASLAMPKGHRTMESIVARMRIMTIGYFGDQYESTSNIKRNRIEDSNGGVVQTGSDAIADEINFDDSSHQKAA